MQVCIKREALGLVISQGRKNKNLTQQQLSNLTGLSRSYIADIEKGRYMPSVTTLVVLATYLQLDLNFLTKMTEIQV
ncbi:helix-turn-helix domain-containing protein [Aneurinibacillus migulanus]|uniref:DNA-binding transcriptional regulator, XRE-family HTH domain n=1 Tax=Aneurinibacillus migulanus TaxID=47500 RepID=A0A0D1XTI3_ANEMI|nr:helix-turn-helix transcriptional regulator [Aneurinibacillus migulanus]KIV57536.1 hypothetical protein TS65_09975 [Aneurinibacillus migulanus]KON94844.1 hypothetical protein AF333_04450 [Aneurinibacillus migulanus]MED0892896.1 helix-turn-helix transcriptional regulator [Aneurinibacillus migulanus]MED1619142.1 helix-turn-helix transcriptional regulator [Aneurinibacillus migulanus]SDI91221.1 DNA-binding transcriptional regulator, XRE-family HTH domain [Aneurinibacillus migulanus]